MKKSNLLFIILTGASVVLISAIMADNITSMPSSVRTGSQVALDQNDTRNTETVRQRFKQMGLSLHEGKYWKKTDE
jgi:hypothetical protein